MASCAGLKCQLYHLLFVTYGASTSSPIRLGNNSTYQLVVMWNE